MCPANHPTETREAHCHKKVGAPQLTACNVSSCKDLRNTEARNYTQGTRTHSNVISVKINVPHVYTRHRPPRTRSGVPTFQLLTSNFSWTCQGQIFSPHQGWKFSLRAGRSGDRIPVGGEIFRVRPDRPWGPSSLLYNGYRVSFPEVKRPGRVVDHPPPFSDEVKERV